MGPYNLVAVQVAWEAGAYQSADAFRRWVLASSEEAVAGLPAAPTLLAFPEAIGLPLLFLGAPEALEADSLPQALSRYLRVRGIAALSALLTRPWRGLAALMLPAALPAYRAYRGAFAEAARALGVTVVAGSSFLPEVDEEGLRGTHLQGRRLFNQSYSFSPSGHLLGVSRKARLAPGLESRLGLARGRLADMRPLATPLGTLGVALCLDAFFDSVVSQFDGLGTRVLVQPSANFAPWDRPWPGDPTSSEGEAWFAHGLRAQLQGRQNLVYGVNPMLIGGLWGLRAEGRSSLLANQRYLPEAASEGLPGLLACAPSASRQAFVRATVNAPEQLSLRVG